MAVFDLEALEFATGLDLSGFERDLKSGVAKFDAAGKRFGDAMSKYVGPAALAVGAALAGLSAVFAKSVVDVGSQFETLQTRLGTLLGSAEAGAARMEEIFAFASSTPFELNELVEAEVNLRALGLAADEVLPLVLDFAGAMGQDLPSAAVEVGRAMQFGAGAVETIAGRALRAQVELRTGTDALKMSTSEFREELTKTLTDPDGIFAGGTQKLAATFSGMVSNLQDQWTGFQKSVADAGTFAAVKAALGVTLDLLNENKAAVVEMADAVSGVLVGSLKLGIDAVGFLADAATGAEFVFYDAARAVVDLARSIFEAARQGNTLLLVLQQLPGVGDVLTYGLDEAEAGLESLSSLLSIAGDEAAANFGRGAETAVRYKDAIDAAVDAARSLGTAAGAIDAGAPGGGITGTDGGGAIEQTEDLYAELLRIQREAGEAAASLERTLYQQRVDELGRYTTTALDLWSDFAASRLAGEESLGATVRRIGLSFLSAQLADLAKSFALVAAAYFATLQPVMGGLYLAGAAVAAAGAAALGQASTGPIFGGGSSASDADSSSSGNGTPTPVTPEQAEAQQADRFSSSSARSTTTVLVVNQVGHRTFDAATYEALNTDGSALSLLRDSTTTRGTRPRG